MHPGGEIARRQFLKLSANAVSAVWLAAAAGELAAGALSCAPVTHSGDWRTFTDADASVIEAAAALIIPSDDTPGAREAHVIHFIDRSLDSFARDQSTLSRRDSRISGSRAATHRPRTRSPTSMSSNNCALHDLMNDKSVSSCASPRDDGRHVRQPRVRRKPRKTGWKLLGFDDQFYWQHPSASTIVPSHESKLTAPAQQQRVTYAPTDEVDFVIVGAGAAGGVVARELSRAGFRVVVLEQGPCLHASGLQARRDRDQQAAALTNDLRTQPNTFRTSTRKSRHRRASCVRPHGRRRHRALHGELLALPRDRLHGAQQEGPVAGTTFADWPITYDELEPYYTKVEWEIGVSGSLARARSIRRAAAAIRCRRCRSSPPACSPRAGRRSSAGTRSRRRWRFSRSRIAAAPRACTADSARPSAARCAPSRARW